MFLSLLCVAGSCSCWLFMPSVYLDYFLLCWAIMLNPVDVALLLNWVFPLLKCAALESWRCQRKQTQPEPHNQGRPPKENLKKRSSTWGEKFFSLWHANLRVALQHILNPLNCRPFVFQHPIISAELANPEPAMVLIKAERVGLVLKQTLRKKKGGGRRK